MHLGPLKPDLSGPKFCQLRLKSDFSALKFYFSTSCPDLSDPKFYFSDRCPDLGSLKFDLSSSCRDLSTLTADLSWCRSAERPGAATDRGRSLIRHPRVTELAPAGALRPGEISENAGPRCLVHIGAPPPQHTGGQRSALPASAGWPGISAGFRPSGSNLSRR